MEPFDDKELSSLLQHWKAPAAPASLSISTAQFRHSRWSWLWKGSIRVPVPVGVAAVLAAVAVWLISFGNSPVPPAVPPAAEHDNVVPPVAVPKIGTPPESAASRQTVSPALAGFQPVSQLEPKIIKEQR